MKSSNRLIKIFFAAELLLSALFLIFMIPARVDAASVNKAYTVKASSPPVNVKYKTYSTYNDKTRQYYMLRSYLEKLEKDGGGTLILSKGTYTITNSLYIPSNVTIILKDGVKILKGTSTDSAKLTPSKSIFQLAAPSKAGIAGAYGGYDGVKDIQIIGEGTAVIDMDFDQDSIGIIIAHNTNVKILGITFKNMRGGHFIELDASKNVMVENCSFLYHMPSSTGIKEAINIDTPDKSTGGLHVTYTNYDCTPDMDIMIKNNYFEDLERAIGTHKYSGGKYHTNVQIINNKIYNTDSDAIRLINWKSPVIEGNEIKKVNVSSDKAILASGLISPVITDNTFIDVPRPIQIMPWKNSGGGSEYDITYNEITDDEINLMLKNYLVNVGEHFIRVNKTYNVYTYDTDKYYYSSEYIK